MKIFIAIAVLACVAGVFGILPKQSPEEQAQVLQNIDQCKIEVPVNEDEFNLLLKDDLSNATDRMFCFIRCFNTKSGFIKDDVVQDDFVAKRLGSIISDEELNEIKAKCKDLQGKTICETAYLVSQCYTDEIKQK